MYFILSDIYHLRNYNFLANGDMIFSVEQERRATEGATEQEDVSESYQLMQQQLKQANETIATLMEQLSRVQTTTS